MKAAARWREGKEPDERSTLLTGRTSLALTRMALAAPPNALVLLGGPRVDEVARLLATGSMSALAAMHHGRAGCGLASVALECRS